MKQKRGRPASPCPSCGEGRREYQVIVQTRPLNYTDEHVSGKKEGARSNTLTVCASCAGKVRAELALALAAHDTWE